MIFLRGETCKIMTFNSIVYNKLITKKKKENEAITNMRIQREKLQKSDEEKK